MKRILCWIICGVAAIAITLGAFFLIREKKMEEPKKISLDKEYYCEENCEEIFITLDTEEYEKLIDEQKTFIVFVDQFMCEAAEKMKGFATDYANENGIKINRVIFSQMKGSTLREKVKYYPSMAIINKGEIIDWLETDVDIDKDKFEDYTVFKDWMDGYLK